MFKEFKEFALKGNVIDLAVGIIIGVEFGKIVTSVVSDIIMPPIGYFLGGVNFSNLFVSLDRHHYSSLDEASKAGAPTINYGIFFSNVFNFLIIAFCVFIMVKAINKLKKTQSLRSSP